MVRGAVAAMLAIAWAAAGARAGGDVTAQVKALLDARCVACHSCYNAPCQLDLTAWEGVARGASRLRVYDGTRLKAAAPTRLFVDAHGAGAWRDRGFYPVTRPLGGDSPAVSLLGRMLALKQQGRDVPVSHTPEWMCPDGRIRMALYSALGRDGMPLGFPALGDEEHALIMGWLDAGARIPGPAAPAPDPGLDARIAAWEALLNADGPRERLVARYLYEHLFLAHLHFEGHPGAFFRLVRSRAPAPAPADEIATVRPYDDPGVARVHYRLVRLTATLVHKTHITFPLSPARLERYRRWFLGSRWDHASPAWPGYAPRTAANPFETFKAIPRLARYRFFLDNARYFVTSFIRGPVCEGQMAVNVINDHFHVLFLDPAFDLSVTDPGFLPAAGELLALPSAGKGDPFEAYYLSYKKRQQRYTAFREERYAAAYPDGFGIDALWDGGREDPDAVLTVFRHFDNAAVVHGARGGVSRTLWVMDYPIFERIYYLLVAGFNVYGNTFHQAATRLYMDNLRVESEDLFLSFLPPAARRVLREQWYRGLLAELKMQVLNPLRGAGRPTAVRYGPGDAKTQFVDQALARLGAAAIRPEPLLNVPASAAAAASAGSREAVERALDRLTLTPALFVQAMPDLTYLVVDFDDGPGLYALIRNKAHTNVAFLLEEDERRVPEEDTLVILRGVVGSYPNFMIHLRAQRVPELVDLLSSWHGDDAERQRLDRDLGISRYRPDFWSHYDVLNALVRRTEGVGGAAMDLGKYEYR